MKIIIVLSLITLITANKINWSWSNGKNKQQRSIDIAVVNDENFKQKSQLKFPGEEIPIKGDTTSARKSRKIEATKNGKTEARGLSGFKRRLCKKGWGINCYKGGKGYDYVELGESPYGYVPQPIQPYGHQHHAGYSGIDASSVLHVQPVALQPVGTPIQAVPLGYGPGATYASNYGYGGHGAVGGYGGHGAVGGYGGHGAVGGYGAAAVAPSAGYGPPVFPPSAGYGAPVVAPSAGYGAPFVAPSAGYGVPGYGSAGVAPATGYGVPGYGSAAGYGTRVSTGFGQYAAPQAHASYGTPPASFGLPENYQVIDFEEPESYLYKADDAFHKADIEPQVVEHYHTHTHIHKDNGNSYSGSGYRPSDSGSGYRPFDSRPSRSDFSSNLIHNSYRENCECVPEHFCSSSDIVRGRLPLIDARTKKTEILSTAKDGKSTLSSTKKKLSRTKRNVVDTIYSSPIRIKPAISSARIRNTPGTSTCVRGEVCCRKPGFTARHLINTCGQRSNGKGFEHQRKLSGKISDSDFGDHPWQVALLKKELNELIYVCGGALVGKQHVITAAHCISSLDYSQLVVRLGEWDVNRKTEYYPHKEIRAKRIITHPQFYSGTMENDIAVIILREPVSLSNNPHIVPACLPDKHDEFTSKRCIVTGWGKNAFGDNGRFQHILKKVDVPIWGHRGCEGAFRSTRLGRDFKLREGMLCAGGEEGKDACEGDGGSPLVCEDNTGSNKLAGIVSWGIGCGRSGIPGVYVDIAHYANWLQQVMHL